MLQEMSKSPIGADLLGIVPGDTVFGWSRLVGRGAAMQPFGYVILEPWDFDPAQSLDPANVGGLGHEMTHVLQRAANRPGMCDNCTTLYSETEAYIIGWAIKYDLTIDPNERQQVKGSLQVATGPLAPMFDWLKQQGSVYAHAGDGVVDTGNWRDTLPNLGFSQATVQHIEDIIK
jgi:hypothetical protein